MTKCKIAAVSAEQSMDRACGVYRNSLHVLQVGAKVLRNLNLQAARNRAAGEALGAEILRIMTEHAGTKRMTAKLVQANLSCTPRPLLRTIQRHMRKVKTKQ